MCSKRWAKPVRPLGSSRKPTPNAVLMPKVGAEWSSDTTTVRPFGSFFTATGTLNALAAGGAASARVGSDARAPAAIKPRIDPPRVQSLGRASKAADVRAVFELSLSTKQIADEFR